MRLQRLNQGYIMDSKCCTKCGKLKPLDSFHKRRDDRNGRRAQCKDCESPRLKINRKNPQVLRRIKEKRNLRRKFPKETLPENMKRCTKCRHVKPVECFGNNKTRKDGRHPSCLDCAKAYWKTVHPPKIKEILPEGTKRCAQCKEIKTIDAFYKQNSSSDGLRYSCKQCLKPYYEQKKKASKTWYENNRARRIAASSAYQKRMRKIDAVLRIRLSLGVRLSQILRKKGTVKAVGTMKLVGCTRNDLMLHLQDQFRDPMSWNNYGTIWEVDHIRPCKSYDLTNTDHQKACFHFSNLQPLFKEENRKKSSKYEITVNS